MSSSQPAPVTKINLPKGMENIMMTRSSSYVVDRPVDRPKRSPPSYTSPDSLEMTDSPFAAENSVQHRHSQSFAGTLPWQQDPTFTAKTELYPLQQERNNDDARSSKSNKSRFSVY